MRSRYKPSSGNHVKAQVYRNLNTLKGWILHPPLLQHSYWAPFRPMQVRGSIYVPEMCPGRPRHGHFTRTTENLVGDEEEWVCKMVNMSMLGLGNDQEYTH